MIQWTDDESIAFVNMNSRIHLYSSSDNFTNIIKSLTLKGIDSFVLSPGKKIKFAAYTPEANGGPASVAIYPLDFDSTNNNTTDSLTDSLTDDSHY